jgi:hypothetical protein
VGAAVGRLERVLVEVAVGVDDRELQVREVLGREPRGREDGAVGDLSEVVGVEVVLPRRIPLRRVVSE